MKDIVIQQLNKQINLEFFSSYFYLNIANYYVEQNLDGFANWFTIQEQEERDHALLILHYLQDNDCKVILEDISATQKDFKTPEEPLHLAYEHEKGVTKRIDSLYETALNEKDYRTMRLLDWFIKEQMEEEKSIKDILDKYHLFANDQKTLYLLDNELKARVYAAPGPVMGV